MNKFNCDSWIQPVPPTDRTVAALRPGSTVVVYGAGTVAQDVIRVLARHDVRVRCIIDAKSNRTEVAGFAVRRPDDPALSPEERASTPVVFGIFNAYVDLAALTRQLATQGWSHIVDFSELHAMWPDEMGDRYWLTRRSFMRDHAADISAVDGLWSDEASRDLYRQILRFRVTGDRSVLSPPDLERQYFPKDIPAWATPLRFVDCGAFDGDTLKQVFALGVPVAAIAAFEPDPINFGKLAQHVWAQRSIMPETVALYPCGVSGATAQIRFSSGEGTGSHASETGSTTIQCVSLDEALPTFRPTLIKMDIESAEYDALLGARRLIAEYRPGLAICLYHRPEHLWQIPLLVRQLTGGGGKYFIRSHCFNGFELVLYWMP